MPVQLAAGVKRRGAGGASVVAGEVGRDAELGLAGAAEHGGRIPLGQRPKLGRMVCQRVVARAAGVVDAAAAHLQRHDVERAMPVGAAALGIELQPADFRRRTHGWRARKSATAALKASAQSRLTGWPPSRSTTSRPGIVAAARSRTAWKPFSRRPL